MRSVGRNSTPKMRWRKGCPRIRFFDDFVAPGVRAAFDGVIGKFPPCEVTSGDRHPYGRMFEALRIAYLQIERHAFECVVVTFDLSTQIACYQREREVVVGVVIVEAEIDGKRPRGVLFVGGVDDFGIDSPRKVVVMSWA